jgi:predicted ATPase
VVVLSGEAGIGKSRLGEELCERVRSEGLPSVAFRCSPYHMTSALYPLIEHLHRILQFQRRDAPETKLDTLEQVPRTYRFPLQEMVPLVAELLAVPLLDRYPLVTLTPQR